MEPIFKKRLVGYAAAAALLIAVAIIARYDKKPVVQDFNQQSATSSVNSESSIPPASSSTVPAIPDTKIESPGKTQATSTASSDINVSQTVQGSNLNQPNPYKLQEGKTAMDLLKATHQVQTKEYSGLGEFVESIDGVKPDSKHFWSFYVNGQSSNIGASQYKPKVGDKVEWKLEQIK